jgi:hypothetical protein
MRNTMDATDAEIQRIKDLASEQQKRGVLKLQVAGAIGDKVGALRATAKNV